MKKLPLVYLVSLFLIFNLNVAGQKKVIKKASASINKKASTANKKSESYKDDVKQGEIIRMESIPQVSGKPQVIDLSNATITPAEWRPYLIKKLQVIVDDASNNGCEAGEYRIEIGFIVDETGKPTNPEILSGGNDCGFGDSCKKIILNGPKWPIANGPDGIAAKSKQKTSILFMIQSEEEDEEVAKIKTHAQPNESWSAYFEKSIIALKKKAKKEGCKKGIYNVKVNYLVDINGAITNAIILDDFHNKKITNDLKLIFTNNKQLWIPAINYDNINVADNRQMEFKIAIN